MDVFVKDEFCPPGERVALLISAFGENEVQARAKMQRTLHTPLCDAFAAELGESLDSRAFGAAMERRARHPAPQRTDAEILAALGPIAEAARKFRHALGRHERGLPILETAFPIGRHLEVWQMRALIDELCTLPERLEDAGWQRKSGRGPIPRSGEDEWLAGCFIHAWACCVGLKVSTTERSRFMRAARTLLPLAGVELGKDPEGRMGRIVKRYMRNLVAPLPYPAPADGGF
ncbi:hypothetical protein [Lysobacter sp. H21R4]|uniref:hypothetical protein n=1 Tax=Lysobacter sp. H21R4 TaxID=2781021 RepID=UPI001E47CDDA|nr:hypothetical protein [Lysobacter sp. H21R4]